MQYALLKAGDGTRVWNQFNQGVVDQCHENGLDCGAWTYCYLDDPAGEANVALSAYANGADCVVLDIEYEAIGKLGQGQELIQRIRDGAGDKWLGHAPDLRIAFGNRWPRGGFNPSLEPWPWEAMSGLDGVMPQLYWTDFAQTPIDTLHLVDLWAEGCRGQGWNVPPVYPIFPSTAYPNDIYNAGVAADSMGFTGANLWRWANGTSGSIAALGSVAWTQPTGSGEEEEDMAVIEALRTYIGEMSGDNGGIIQALDRELAKKQPDKEQIRNIRNRLIELRQEALGE